MKILEDLKLKGELIPAPLPTEKEVKIAEEKLGVKFPPSYVEYQLAYSNYGYGTFEPYLLFEDGSHLDLLNGVGEARKQGLPGNLFPFLEDNGDYYCFDVSSPAPDYQVKFWSHDGTNHDQWKNFLDWVEHCWLEEQ